MHSHLLANNAIFEGHFTQVPSSDLNEPFPQTHVLKISSYTWLVPHFLHYPLMRTLGLAHSHVKLCWLNTPFLPHWMQSSNTGIKSGLQTQRLVNSTNCSTLLGPQGVVESKQIPFAFKVLGGGQIQFPEASGIKPFLQTQKLFESIYFPA